MKKSFKIILILFVLICSIILIHQNNTSPVYRIVIREDNLFEVQYRYFAFDWMTISNPYKTIEEARKKRISSIKSDKQKDYENSLKRTVVEK